jgi:hypothetical protein
MAMPRSDGGTSLHQHGRRGESCRSVIVFEPRDEPQQRRLAAARRADEDDELTMLDVEIDALDDLDIAIGLEERLQLQSGHVDYPLTAPAVIPATICRLKNRKTISGGMVISRMLVKSRL